MVGDDIYKGLGIINAYKSIAFILISIKSLPMDFYQLTLLSNSQFP